MKIFSTPKQSFIALILFCVALTQLPVAKADDSSKPKIAIDRLATPGGWIVVVRYQEKLSSTYVPDETHSWVVDVNQPTK